VTGTTPRSDLAEESEESRWEAAPAVLVVIAAQLALALVSAHGDWKLWHLPWWAWLILIGPELVLLGALGWSLPRHQLEQMGARRNVSLTLLGVVSLGNGWALVALLGSLLEGHESDGGQLLYKGMTIWTTNMISFGLWYWAFDRGGPVRRFEPDPPLPDFSFPQLQDPDLAPADWRPHLLDYLYVALTNSIAFSPTDTLPLTHKAKVMMALQSSASAVTILLVAARAVNILN
jgi:hypothetical protein